MAGIMQKIIKVCGIENWKVRQYGPICGYLRQGSTGKPVLHLLHGNGFSALSLLAMAENLPEDWTLLLTDVPGHGASSLPKADKPDWSGMAALIAESLRERHGGPVIGVGHSMGGVLSLKMAAAAPRMFDQLILLDPVLFPPWMLVAQRVLRLVRLAEKMPLPARTLKRRRNWLDRDDACVYLRQRALYREWHPRALQGFAASGLRECLPHGVELSCQPEWEAAIFASDPGTIWNDVGRLAIRADILVASRGYGFIGPAARRATRLNRNFHIHPVAGSHCFPMENPQLAASLILECIGLSENGRRAQ